VSKRELAPLDVAVVNARSARTIMAGLVASFERINAPGEVRRCWS
jgi:hypothetical protein